VQAETIRRLNTGELIARLVENVSGIFDREIALAKEEARHDARQAVVGGAALAIGGILLYTVLPAIVAAIALAIWPTLSPVWIALIVAAFFLVVGAIVAFYGWQNVKLQPLERTRDSLKEDVTWARSQTTSPKR
jgi:hypothetical protein